MTSQDACEEKLACLGPAERVRVAWILDVLRWPGREIEVSEVGEVFHVNYSQRLASVAKFLTRRSERLKACRALEVARDAADVVEVRLQDASGRSWTLRVRVHPDPPHRVSFFRVARPFPSGASVREATEADGEAIAEIEAGSGIEREDGSRVTTILGSGLVARDGVYVDHVYF